MCVKVCVDAQGEKFQNLRFRSKRVLYSGETRSFNKRLQEQTKRLRYLPTTQYVEVHNRILLVHCVY